MDLRLSQTIKNHFEIIVKSTRFYQLLRSSLIEFLQNNYSMQVLVCTVNSDSKFHNTKSKTSNCRKCDWHLHG